MMVKEVLAPVNANIISIDKDKSVADAITRWLNMR